MRTWKVLKRWYISINYHIANPGLINNNITIHKTLNITRIDGYINYVERRNHTWYDELVNNTAGMVGPACFSSVVWPSVSIEIPSINEERS